MSRIEKFIRRSDYASGGLTPDELQRMREHSAMWIARAMRTEPIEPDKIVPAIVDLYAATGLKAPRVVLVPSPRIMAFAGGFASAIWWLRKNPTGAATEAATRDATGAATWDATDIFVIIAREIFGSNADFGLRCARNWSRQYQGGNMWAGYDCYLSAARDILGLRLPAHEKYAAWEQCAIHGGFRIMHDEFCMVSDFPEILTKDDRNRPHNDTGPSHRWRDGWEVHHIHGVRVTKQIVERPQEITVAMIDGEANAEIRRIMIDRYGSARYVKDSGATIVHELPENYFVKGLRTAKLYRKEVPDDEPILMLDMLNSTPEPDGTTKRYTLRVDPKAYDGEAAKDCTAAMASTWRNQDGSLVFKKPTHYKPIFES